MTAGSRCLRPGPVLLFPSLLHARLLEQRQLLLQSRLFLLHQLFALADLRHLAVE